MLFYPKHIAHYWILDQNKRQKKPQKKYKTLHMFWLYDHFKQYCLQYFIENIWFISPFKVEKSIKHTHFGKRLLYVLHIYLEEISNKWERSGARRKLPSPRALSPEWEEKQKGEAEYQDCDWIHGDPSYCIEQLSSGCRINILYFMVSLTHQQDNV